MGAELAAHFQFWAFNSIQSQARIVSWIFHLSEFAFNKNAIPSSELTVRELLINT